MTYQGYSESELVANRASLFLSGGSVHDRRAWAEEAQRSFEGEGPLVVVTSGAELTAALTRSRGVVYVPDVTALSQDEQGRIVRCLQEREERPKFVLALGEQPQQAMNHGRLRGDLWYRLAQAQVDLTPSELKDAIRARRQLAEAAAAKAAKAAPPVAPAGKSTRGTKTAPSKAAARSLKAPPMRAAKPAAHKAKAPPPRPKTVATRAKTRPAKKR